LCGFLLGALLSHAVCDFGNRATSGGKATTGHLGLGRATQGRHGAQQWL
jgi:hypothetical protein